MKNLRGGSWGGGGGATIYYIYIYIYMVPPPPMDLPFFLKPRLDRCFKKGWLLQNIGFTNVFEPLPSKNIGFTDVF